MIFISCPVDPTQLHLYANEINILFGIALHHQLTNHNCSMPNLQYKQLTLESWYTNLEPTPLNRCQRLLAPYKRFIHCENETDKRTGVGGGRGGT